MPQSTIITPLLEGEKLVGTLTLITDVTERVITESLLQRQVDKLNFLHENDRALATLDLQQCLNNIVQRTRALFSANCAALLLYQAGRLSIAAIEQEGVANPLKRGIANWVAMNRQSVLVPDTRNDERYLSPLSDFCTEMAAPLIVDDEKFIGVLDVQAKDINAYLQEELELLDSLAARADTERAVLTEIGNIILNATVGTMCTQMNAHVQYNLPEVLLQPNWDQFNVSFESIEENPNKRWLLLTSQLSIGGHEGTSHILLILDYPSEVKKRVMEHS